MPWEKDPELTPIFNALKDGVPPHVDIEARCRLIQKINHSADRRMRMIKKGDVISPDMLGAEDTALLTLVSSLNYTDRFIDFFNHNAKKMGLIEAQKIAFPIFEKNWRTLDEDARLSTLKEQRLRQLKLFDHDGMVFTAPEMIKAEMQGLRGGFFPGSWTLSTRINDKLIALNIDNLRQGSAAQNCRTNWHEHVHSLCQQFGALCDTKEMNSLNPFYTDAKLMRLRRKYDTGTRGHFPLTYQADPEENLARTTMDAFVDSWMDNSRLWPQLKMKLGLKL